MQKQYKERCNFAAAMILSASPRLFGRRSKCKILKENRYILRKSSSYLLRMSVFWMGWCRMPLYPILNIIIIIFMKIIVMNLLNIKIVSIKTGSVSDACGSGRGGTVWINTNWRTLRRGSQSKARPSAVGRIQGGQAFRTKAWIAKRQIKCPCPVC